MMGKDMALLDATLSPTRVDSLSERLARLRREISRGAAVYSPAELSRLQRQLEEYEELLKVLSNP
jgi:uncharacterized small protein (DUF1192 family)